MMSGVSVLLNAVVVTKRNILPSRTALRLEVRSAQSQEFKRKNAIHTSVLQLIVRVIGVGNGANAPQRAAKEPKP